MDQRQCPRLGSLANPQPMRPCYGPTEERIYLGGLLDELGGSVPYSLLIAATQRRMKWDEAGCCLVDPCQPIQKCHPTMQSVFSSREMLDTVLSDLHRLGHVNPSHGSATSAVVRRERRLPPTIHAVAFLCQALPGEHFLQDDYLVRSRAVVAILSKIGPQLKQLAVSLDLADDFACVLIAATIEKHVEDPCCLDWVQQARSLTEDSPEQGTAAQMLAARTMDTTADDPRILARQVLWQYQKTLNERSEDTEPPSLLLPRFQARLEGSSQLLAWARLSLYALSAWSSRPTPTEMNDCRRFLEELLHFPREWDNNTWWSWVVNVTCSRCRGLILGQPARDILARSLTPGEFQRYNIASTYDCWCMS